MPPLFRKRPAFSASALLVAWRNGEIYSHCTRVSGADLLWCERYGEPVERVAAGHQQTLLRYADRPPPGR